MMSFTPNNDKLGIGVRGRARAFNAANRTHNRNLAKQHGVFANFSNVGPIVDPMWEGFRHALYEQGTDRVAADSAMTTPGLGETGHISTAALSGFGSAAQAAGYPMPESHDSWMAKHAPRRGR
jgi:hypothetical protein